MLAGAFAPVAILLSSSAGAAGTLSPLPVTGSQAIAVQEAALARLAATGLPVYCGGHRGNMVALTFDDGPGPYTPRALRKLSARADKATFFIVGRNVARYPGAVQRELRHDAIGDHTWTHPLLTTLAPARAESEMARTQSLLVRVSGAPVQLFRPPYGGRDRTIDAIARRLGMVEVLWTVDSADSLGASYARIEHNVIAGLHPGAIILMHENHGQTIRALPTILPAITARHLRAVTLPELLSSDPPTPAQLRAGGLGCGGQLGGGG